MWFVPGTELVGRFRDVSLDEIRLVIQMVGLVFDCGISTTETVARLPDAWLQQISDSMHATHIESPF